MNNYSRLRGTGVALVTPFHISGEIDFTSLEKIVNHVIENGVDYLVALGTTGESVTLDKEEKIAIYNSIRKTNNKRVPLVLGIGGNNTAKIVKQFSLFDMTGVDAVLSVSPYYNKPSQKGIAEHFKVVADNSPAPVILYNVPGRTGSNMTAETTLQLASHLNIIGIKEASGNIEQCMQIIKHRKDNFLLISGDDNLTLPLISCGADGVISVVANAFPKIFSDMVARCLKGDFERARTLHYTLSDIIPLLFTEGSPAGVKDVLKKLGLSSDTVRLPLTTISNTLADKISSEMNKIH